MKLTVTRKEEVDVTYLQIDAGVRYWDDGTPEDMPFREGDRWQPLIDLRTGHIVDWPKGVTADIHYKVCDDGTYSLLDVDRKFVTKKSWYVPKMLSPKENGYGDYIIMDIDGDGKIADFKADLGFFEEGEEDD